MSEEVRGVDEDEFRLATTAWPSTYGDAARPRVGFFTDTSVCIGCKACEVACKEWNEVPEDGLAHRGFSMDNTGGLGADTWRHVAFIEQRRPLDVADAPGDLVARAALGSLAEHAALEPEEHGACAG